MSQDGQPQDERPPDSNRAPAPPPTGPPADQPRPSSYGSPASPSYGKWGSGQADSPAPEAQTSPPTQPTTQFGWPAPSGPPSAPPPPGYGYGPPGSPGQGYGPQGYGPPGYAGPGYSGYPGFGAPRSALRRTRSLGTAVIVLTGLVTAAMWIDVLVAPVGRYLYTSTGGAEQLPGRAQRYLGILVWIFVLMVGSWILSSIWLGQIRENALLLDPAGQRRAAVWVWIGWFVPIVAFWFPKQILDDTIRATAGASGLARRIRTAPYWAAWVLTFVQFFFAGPVSYRTTRDDEAILIVIRPGLQLLAAVLMTITFVLWARLVHQLSAAQDELAAGGPLGPLPPVPPFGS